MQVKNMTSPKGNKVPNQFIIENNGAFYFQSYKSIVAMVAGSNLWIDPRFYKYSRTTSKYLNLFLRSQNKSIDTAIFMELDQS